MAVVNSQNKDTKTASSNVRDILKFVNKFRKDLLCCVGILEKWISRLRSAQYDCKISADPRGDPQLLTKFMINNRTDA